MGVWQVFYADRRTECCGTPFAVGEEVSLPLLLTDADDLLGGGVSSPAPAPPQLRPRTARPADRTP
ncbi:DUF6578 domain-containing protein [Streptomyces sp. NPDC001315]|uniref:DUF6578 domain-containing protein n=1 Tax=Streptomyces sp. NPDC001315 TaxID=3364562 RepID=UPI00368B8A11